MRDGAPSCAGRFDRGAAGGGLYSLVVAETEGRGSNLTQGIVFLVLEAIFLPLIGVPVFIHHLRKGLPLREALAASMDSVMNFLAGWI